MTDVGRRGVRAARGRGGGRPWPAGSARARPASRRRVELPPLGRADRGARPAPPDPRGRPRRRALRGLARDRCSLAARGSTIPAELAHQVVPPDVPAAVSDLVQGVINQPMSIYEMGPAANAMEARGGRVDGRAGGVGGGGRRRAHARRVARQPDRAARRAGGGGSRGVARRGGRHAGGAGAASAHYSIKRSVAMLGLGEQAVIPLEVDEYERIVPGALGAGARARRRRPAGARWRWWPRRAPRAPGLHDDLEAIGALLPRARDLVPRGRRARRLGAALAAPTGTCCAGSSTPTRSSGTPTRCCAPRALCRGGPASRESARLDAAFRQTASYLIYEEAGRRGPNLLGRQVECTKAAARHEDAS